MARAQLDPIDAQTAAADSRFALDLLGADSEDEVIAILKEAGYWDERRCWRLYGDKEGNFAQAGNQQSLPEAAFVEKIVNCVDSRLMNECLRAGIDPESEAAPTSVRDAVAMFFENRRATDNEAGTLINWQKTKRTDESRFITAAATGERNTHRQRQDDSTSAHTTSSDVSDTSPRRGARISQKVCVKQRSPSRPSA